jgi:hypothetical protein
LDFIGRKKRKRVFLLARDTCHFVYAESFGQHVPLERLIAAVEKCQDSRMWIERKRPAAGGHFAGDDIGSGVAIEVR